MYALGNSYSATFSFNMNGTSLNATVGSASYLYPRLISTNNAASLTGGTINASCKKRGTVNAPGDTTWAFPPPLDLSYEGTPSLNAGGAEDEGLCEDDTYRAAPGGILTVGKSKEAALLEKLSPPMTLVTKKGGGSPVNKAVCTPYSGGGSGGGSEGGTQYHLFCYFVDHYDWDGNFLYTSNMGCWLEAM